MNELSNQEIKELNEAMQRLKLVTESTHEETLKLCEAFNSTYKKFKV